ncbi:MmyB family transcriptional regulator [Modestobacter sp. SYSU DS0511]
MGAQSPGHLDGRPAVHSTGVKQFRHPAVGTLDPVHHSFTVPTEDHGELSMTTYTAEPGTSSEETLEVLASWAATSTITDDQPRSDGRSAVTSPAGPFHLPHSVPGDGSS